MRTLRRFAKHRMAVVGVIVIVVLIILAIVGSEAAALKQNLGDGQQAAVARALVRAPTATAATCSRARSSAAACRSPSAWSRRCSRRCIGTILGAIAGFYPRADLVIMRVVDIVMSFPTIILLLIAVSVLGPGIINLMIMIGLITWTIPCRIVRGQFLLLRESDFATAARVVGLSRHRRS